MESMSADVIILRSDVNTAKMMLSWDDEPSVVSDGAIRFRRHIKKQVMMLSDNSEDNKIKLAEDII